MTEIHPRWEWRTFGESFGSADERFAGLTPTGVQESDELYLLSDATANVKVRFELVDVKVLVATNADGLEQWRPILKAEFPLQQETIGEVFAAVGLSLPPLARSSYTLDQFVDELARPNGLRRVQVHKRRVRYVVNGCTAEVSEVLADDIPTRTIAIESEDQDAVVAAVRSVGLSDYVNTSYGKGLLAAVTHAPERYAVIDVGTNSVKFHVAERGTDGQWQRVVDRSEIARLGEGLEESGIISAAPLERTADAIAGMAAEARGLGARAIATVGTAAFRSAANSDEAIDAIKHRAGVTPEVLSGDEETRIAYLGAKGGLPGDTALTVVFDTGGGSSQFTFGRGETVDDRFSVNVGAVRFTESYGLDRAVSAEVVAQARAAIAADLSRLDSRTAPQMVVGMGGAVTNLTAVSKALAAYDPDVIQGSTLDAAEIERQIELYRTRTADERRSIVGLQPKRAEVILAGACIVRTILEKLGAESMTVSDRGLRHGVLVERFRSSVAEMHEVAQ